MRAEGVTPVAAAAAGAAASIGAQGLGNDQCFFPLHLRRRLRHPGYLPAAELWLGVAGVDVTRAVSEFWILTSRLVGLAPVNKGCGLLSEETKEPAYQICFRTADEQVRKNGPLKVSVYQRSLVSLSAIIGSKGHIQDVSQNPELDVSAAKHIPEMDTSQKDISSQCEGTESNGELQPEWSKTAGDLSDDVSGREQGAENRVTETERSKAAWDMRNNVSADVLGREQEAKNGGTGAEQVFMTKIDNKIIQWRIQDELHNAEFDVLLEKDTRLKEITIQCKDREERVGELQLEKSKVAKVTRNQLYDDVSGREQGAGNGGTETEKRKAAWDMRNDLSVDTFGRPQGAENGATETDQVFMMKKINENTEWHIHNTLVGSELDLSDANHVSKKGTNQREINSQCKNEKGQDGELHSEKSKAVRDMRNDSSDDVPDAKQGLEKDKGLREIKSQCKDEKQRDGDLHPERNKVSRYLRNDSSDDVPSREHAAENGYTEPESSTSVLEKDTENTNAKQLLEKDAYQRDINSQCKDEKERDGELHPEKSKTARDTMNDSFDDVLGRKHGVENGYTEPESLMDKDTKH